MTHQERQNASVERGNDGPKCRREETTREKTTKKSLASRSTEQRAPRTHQQRQKKTSEDNTRRKQNSERRHTRRARRAAYLLVSHAPCLALGGVVRLVHGQHPSKRLQTRCRDAACGITGKFLRRRRALAGRKIFLSLITFLGCQTGPGEDR